MGFDDWLTGFAARAEGIPPEVLDRALGGLAPLPEVIEKDRHQPEHRLSLSAYLARTVTPERIAAGQAALRAQAEALATIRLRTGVEAEVIVAIWGLESNYGQIRGDFPVIAALATLAHDGRRAALFEAELRAALRIVAAGVSPDQLRGSWAGAMGHTQFMPSSYLAHAEPLEGPGPAEIWGDDPRDALASTAAYLRDHGWQPGKPWAVEVTLPEGFDFAETGPETLRPAADWASLGVKRCDGQPLSGRDEAALLLPQGAGGLALLAFANYRAIARYNAADAYVIAVGHLAERFRGDRPFGRLLDQPALGRSEMAALQAALTARGFDTLGADGFSGPNTRRAIRAYQRANGLPEDGFPSPALLAALDGAAL